MSQMCYKYVENVKPSTADTVLFHYTTSLHDKQSWANTRQLLRQSDPVLMLNNIALRKTARYNVETLF